MNRTLSIVASGRHKTLKREWAEDSAEHIKVLANKHLGNLDVKMISVVGEKIPAAVRGESTILEHLLKDNMLDDFYKVGSGFQRYNKFLAGMMKQITHRYPHTKILEIGAGTGGATKYVLEEIGKSMSSYTYTDISVGFFGNAAELFKAYSDKMTFKVLDVEKTPASQGCEEHSYDIVIASNVLHATESLHTTLVNTRKLLKPGGYLMLLEITNNEPIRNGFVWGSLAGWWLGVNDGRRWAPTITPGMWHSALRKASFARVDAVTPEIDSVAWPFSILASQAVDDRVNFLRKPLSSSSPSIFIESLVILGNGSLESAHIAEALSDQLRRFCGELTVLDGLPTETEAFDLNPMSTFINLVDIDSPIFKDITAEKMDGLQRVLELVKHVLWITQGALSEQPYSMASTTFSRAVRREAGHVSLNHLDTSDLQDPNVPKFIAEHLLQLYALDEWETPHIGDGQENKPLLWSKEPEAFLDGGKLVLPRRLSNEDQNARLNSFRRVITKTVPISGSNVSISPPHGDLPASLVVPVSLTACKEQQDLLVSVNSSSLVALSVLAYTFLFLAIGKDATGATFVSLSSTNSREISPIASVPAHVYASQSTDSLLIATASELLVESLVQGLPSGSHMLVHCSGRDRLLTQALSRRAASGAISVTYTCNTDDNQNAQDPAWIKLSARASNHVTRRTVQRAKPTHFLDLTTSLSATEISDLGLSIAQTLPSACKQISYSSLFQHQSSLPSPLNQEILVARLQDAVSSADPLTVTQENLRDLVIPFDNISDPAMPYHTTSAVHWPSNGNVKVGVRPINAQGFFSKEKTYILIGLSGKIGQSLTEWMVSNGARCVCLTSRRPDIDERWMKSFEGTGASVKIYPMDVTDMRSLEAVVNDIRATCPPIAGVANGAMVLSDTLFSKMSTEKMAKVLRPKIDGSNNVDELFYNEQLDFFVLFSSASCIVGNVGQSNYSAANGYINSLVRQRRKRGLAASTFDISQVAGIGYIETSGQVVMDQLASLGLRPLSETDLRQAFAETIRSGHSDPKDKDNIPDAVLTTGIRHFSEDEDIKGPWFSNPFFSHYVITSKAAESGSEQQDKKTVVPAAKQISKATTREQALEILQGRLSDRFLSMSSCYTNDQTECFAAKLRVILQLSDQAMDYDAPLVELGIDSLVAVEVRSWLLKEFRVDIPVHKVVGGASLTELCQKALEKMPEELLTGIGKEDTKFEPKTQSQFYPQITPKVDTGSSAASEYSSVPATTPGASLFSPAQAGSSLGTTRSVSPDEGSKDDEKVSSEPSYFPPHPVLVPTSVLAGSERPPKRFLKSVPISLSQSRFWFLQRLLENKKTHNVAYYYHVKGDLNVSDLERVVRVVTSRHESLRTCFIPDEFDSAQGYQKVLPSSPVRLERKKIDSVDEVATEYQKLGTSDIDMASGELLRLVLLTLTPSSHYLLMYHHHIIMDGVSLQVFLSDLEKAYMGVSLGAPPRQYPEFSVAQRRAFENGEMSKELEYWRAVFPDGKQPPILPLLPMARTSSRVAMAKFDAHQVQWRLDPVLAARIKSVSKAQRSTPFHLYLAAFQSMLFCFTNTDDLTIGVADAARNDGDVIGSIGFFLNLLTLRFRRQPDQSFAGAIADARDTTYAALDNSRLPFDVLLAELNVERDSTHSPFFQAFLDYRQGLQKRQAWGGCELEM